MRLKLTLVDHWRFFRRRLKLDTLKVGTKFEFHPSCILLTSGCYHPFQEVVHLTSYDVDGFGHECYTVTSRGKDNREVTFAVSHFTPHSAGCILIKPRHLLNRKSTRA